MAGLKWNLPDAEDFQCALFGWWYRSWGFNGDGKVDLAMVGVADPRTQAGEVLILLGNGDGTLQIPERVFRGN